MAKSKHPIIRALRHMIIDLIVLFMCLEIPYYHFTGSFRLFNSNPDTVTQASVEIPEQPSGEYLVLINRRLHESALPEWKRFFSEQEVGVIMEDISCITVLGDTAGQLLAERYQARLAQNQMKLRRENGTLVVSKAEYGSFDVLIFSKEIAEQLNLLKAEQLESAEAIRITGGSQ